MKVYLAAAYSRRDELCGYRDALEADGITVTSEWLQGPSQRHVDGLVLTPEIEAEIESRTFDSWRAVMYADRCARQDITDVEASDLLVMFTGGGRGGGRHVEVGFALALGLPIILVGPRENVFHCLQPVETFGDWTAAHVELRRRASSNCDGSREAAHSSGGVS